MNQKILYGLWGLFFLLCGGLGFAVDAAGKWQWVLMMLSLVHFLPPAFLLYRARKDGDRNTALLVRNLAALSLLLTLVTLILNLILAVRSEALGNVLHSILIVVSSPMICSGHWALSLFLWACLLMAGAKGSRKRK